MVRSCGDRRHALAVDLILISAFRREDLIYPLAVDYRLVYPLGINLGRGLVPVPPSHRHSWSDRLSGEFGNGARWKEMHSSL